MSATPARTTQAVHTQWEVLRAWLEELPDDVSGQPSSLPGWRVGDLVAHLARALDSVLLCEVQAEDTDPQTLGEYLAPSASSAEETSVATKRLAAAIAGDPLAALDERAERALARLDELSGSGEDLVVLARRGPIRWHDFVITRLIELVVHAYDLARELPLPVPVDPTARTIVAEALLDVVRRSTGQDVVVGDEAAWIKVATGRISWPEGITRTAIRPASPSDGTPDLSPVLPLL